MTVALSTSRKGEDPLICRSPHVPDNEGEAGDDGMDVSSTSEDVDDKDVEGGEDVACASVKEPIAVEPTRKSKFQKHHIGENAICP
jgi:hypothetical protein